MKRTRADSNNDLVIPVIKHKSFGGRSLGYGGPKLWNTLPKELKTCTNINTFKKLLKTFLFKEAYLQQLYTKCAFYYYLFLFIHLFIPLSYTFFTLFILVNIYSFIYFYLLFQDCEAL